MSVIMPYKLDRINRRILFELDKNCRISDNKLAKLVHRSRESVRHRINKLVKDGIIKGFITSINPSKFGYMFFKLYFQFIQKLGFEAVGHTIIIRPENQCVISLANEAQFIKMIRDFCTL